MDKKIRSFFKNDSLKTQILATLIATTIIWIITVIFGIIKGLDFSSSIKWSIEILQYKINLFWFIILILGMLILNSRKNKMLLEKIQDLTYTKEQIDTKNKYIKQNIDKKLNISRFERFTDIYDYRRLKNHPYHEQYTLNDVESFVTILKEGNKNSDIYKVQNGMDGLIAELKQEGRIHRTVKNEIKEEIENCFTDKFLHQKEELSKVLDEIRVY
ncbi:hypothetical protein [Salegentibacter maritimus]|uniref:Uncharacterized protein n=1 Tax=Salegentibacter maritimus TaxID=2794347 RepID=A0ABS0TMX5_9FLAO|nr:hypothetical protein [Salegentibacter maritimus]MBI6121353.1 hypothetical protein [Salegentibacter maritimus]